MRSRPWPPETSSELSIESIRSRYPIRSELLPVYMISMGLSSHASNCGFTEHIIQSTSNALLNSHCNNNGSISLVQESYRHIGLLGVDDWRTSMVSMRHRNSRSKSGPHNYSTCWLSTSLLTYTLWSLDELAVNVSGGVTQCTGDSSYATPTRSPFTGQVLPYLTQWRVNELLELNIFGVKVTRV